MSTATTTRRSETAVRRAPRPGDHALMIAEGDVDLARAIERADAHNLSYRLTWLDQRGMGDAREIGVERFEVPSASFVDVQYRVMYDAADGTYSCTCPAVTLSRRTCQHAGAVAKFLWRLRRDLSPAGQATQAAYERWCDAHGL